MESKFRPGDIVMVISCAPPFSKDIGKCLIVTNAAKTGDKFQIRYKGFETSVMEAHFDGYGCVAIRPHDKFHAMAPDGQIYLSDNGFWPEDYLLLLSGYVE